MQQFLSFKASRPSPLGGHTLDEPTPSPKGNFCERLAPPTLRGIRLQSHPEAPCPLQYLVGSKRRPLESKALRNGFKGYAYLSFIVHTRSMIANSLVGSLYQLRFGAHTCICPETLLLGRICVVVVKAVARTLDFPPRWQPCLDVQLIAVYAPISPF